MWTMFTTCYICINALGDTSLILISCNQQWDEQLLKFLSGSK